MQLQKECSTALQFYVELVKEGCALLAEVKEVPMLENQRNAIFSHRRQELLAQSAYTKARRRLWDCLIDSKPVARVDDVMGQGDSGPVILG